MLRYQPKEGSIVICNFNGFQSPEIVKTRPVIIVRRHRENRGLVTVVPMSMTEPYIVKNYHQLLDDEFSILHFNKTNCWVKCDMIYVISIKRLRFFKDEGFKKREIFIDTNMLLEIKRKIGYALQIISPSEKPV